MKQILETLEWVWWEWFSGLDDKKNVDGFINTTASQLAVNRLDHLKKVLGEDIVEYKKQVREDTLNEVKGVLENTFEGQAETILKVENAWNVILLNERIKRDK